MSNDLNTVNNQDSLQTVPDSTNHFVKIPKHHDSKFEENIPNDYRELSESEAIQVLKAGKPLEKNVYIRQLSLSGEFNKAIQLKQVHIRHLNIHQLTSLLNFNMSSCHIRRAIIDEAKI